MSLKRIALCTLLWTSAAAQACECARMPLDDQAAKAATEVFVFRLMSAAVDDSNPDAVQNLVGRIEVVETLRGKPAPRALRYSIFRCCGIRLEVGEYYAGFTTDVGAEFFGDVDNLLPLGESYESGRRRGLRLHDVVAGRVSVDTAFPDPMLRIEQLPRPPPPPCAAGGNVP